MCSGASFTQATVGAAQLDGTKPDAGHEDHQHQRRADHRRNVATRQPADKRVERHARHARQDDGQRYGFGEVKEGDCAGGHETICAAVSRGRGAASGAEETSAAAGSFCGGGWR